MSVSPRDRFAGHLEQLVKHQRALDEARESLNGVRLEARAEGLNLEAINALLPLLSKYPHEKAARVLSEFIHYAQAYGIELPIMRNRAAPTAAAGTTGIGVAASMATSTQGSSLQSQIAPASAGLPLRAQRVRLPTQIFAAGLLAIGLIWLLN